MGMSDECSCSQNGKLMSWSAIWVEGQADRQASRQTDTQTDSWETDRQTDSWETDRQTDRQLGDRQTDRQTAGRQTDRQTASWETDRQTDRHLKCTDGRTLRVYRLEPCSAIQPMSDRCTDIHTDVQVNGQSKGCCRVQSSGVEMRTHRQADEWTHSKNVDVRTPALRHSPSQSWNLAAAAAVCLLGEPDLTFCLLSQPVTWNLH